VRFVQVVGSTDHHSVHVFQLQEVFYVGDHIGDAEPFSERARLGSVVVAQSHDLDAAKAG
jgi:hypothetical protein